MEPLRTARAVTAAVECGWERKVEMRRPLYEAQMVTSCTTSNTITTTTATWYYYYYDYCYDYYYCMRRRWSLTPAVSFRAHRRGR